MESRILIKKSLLAMSCRITPCEPETLALQQRSASIVRAEERDEQ
jgi:hypothetical protein